MNEDALKPMFKKYPFLIPVAAIFALVISPILIPAALIIDNKEEVKKYYREAIWGLLYPFRKVLLKKSDDTQPS